ncbi:MAG: acyl carrier protein [Acetobacteraceae bacterium]|nr:acyl carrier protein [Acetobacteraceae bacterium]
MAESDIYAALTRILRAVFVRDDLVATPELTARDVIGWDSFRHVELVMAVEETFDIKIRLREQSSLRALSDLAALIATKLQAKN